MPVKVGHSIAQEFVVHLVRHERVAFEELVRVQLSDRGAGLEKHEVGRVAEALTNPAVPLELVHCLSTYGFDG